MSWFWIYLGRHQISLRDPNVLGVPNIGPCNYFAEQKTRFYKRIYFYQRLDDYSDSIDDEYYGFSVREKEFKPGVNLWQSSDHPLFPRDGTVPPSIGKRRPAPMFILLYALWKYDCVSSPLTGITTSE